MPTIQYTPEHVATDVHKPAVPDKATKTADYDIPASEAYNYIFTQTGATADVECGRPAAVVGMGPGIFFVHGTDGLTIDPDGTETIGAGAAGHYFSANAIGEF